MRPWIALVAACAAGCAPAAPAVVQAPHADPAPTRVTIFVPVVPSGTPRDGSCWTVSIAAARRGAWRCAMGNMISDPCFVPPSTEGVVVCGADPATGDPGFAMHLTKPLPTDVPTASSTAEPWLLRLADGEVCTPFTGTVPMVGSEQARWSCSDPSTPGSAGLLTRVDRATTWTVDWYPATEGHSPAHPSQPSAPARRIPVTDVWE